MNELDVLDKVQIKIDIEKLEFQKSQIEAGIKIYRKTIDLLEEIIDVCIRIKTGILNKINETENAIHIKANELSRYNKFKYQYKNDTRNILHGSKINTTINTISFSIRKLKNIVAEKEELIDEKVRTINSLDEEIVYLNNLLNREE